VVGGQCGVAGLDADEGGAEAALVQLAAGDGDVGGAFQQARGARTGLDEDQRGTGVLSRPAPL
jgi:hypothetical protein